MTDTLSTPQIDPSRVEEFVGTLLTDFAGAGTTAMIVLGDRLGLYQALAASGPVTSDELAAATGTHPRLVAEWTAQQVVSGYLVKTGDLVELPAEHALALAVVDSPAYVVGAADIVTGWFGSLDQLETAFRGDGGLDYAAVPHSIHHGIERFFRTAYVNELAQSWFPAVPGLVERLDDGARVADIGCGHGVATRLMARTWPRSSVVGIDFHEPSIAVARAKAVEEGGDGGDVTFRVADSAGIGGPYDVVTYFDALHDLGDPAASLRAAFAALTPGGILVAVEPWSSDDWESLVGKPDARVNFAASTALCTPTSLAQPGAYGLGNQGGPTPRLRLLAEAGFVGAVVAADTGFNLVFAARKPLG